MSELTLPNNQLAKLQVYADEYVVAATFNRPTLRTLQNDEYILSCIKTLSGDMADTYVELKIFMDSLKLGVNTSVEAVETEVNDEIVARLNNVSTHLLPIGSCLRWPLTTSIPSSFLPCLGGEYLRASYTALYSLIGLTFGTGSSINNFRVPYYGYLYGVDSKVYIWIMRAI